MITDKMILECTGCSACVDNCPKKCISMKYDAEGFRIPSVDSSRCINCRICEMNCPMNSNVYQKVARNAKARAYAAFSKNEETRKASATGGIFYEIARKMIQENGVVYGAVGSALKGVTHVKAENIDELHAMQGSKYVQSDMQGVYLQVKEDLKKKKKVLFSGTPCQVAALYSVIGKDDDNLITMDVICHGVPSEKVLHKFISEWEIKKNKKVINYYRDKEMGWKPPRYAFDYEDGSKECFVSTEIPYNRGFIQNLYIRKVCTHCRFAQIPRISDITVGDWFGGNKSKELDPDNKGLSMVVGNSAKGQALLDDISDAIFFKEYTIEEAVQESEHLGKTPKENILRPIFFKLNNRYSFLKLAVFLLPTNKVLRVVRKVFIIVLNMGRK